MSAPIFGTPATYVANSSVLVHPIPMPEGIIAGDLLLVVDRNASSFVAPTGWTRLRFASSSVYSTIYYRIADGSEGATVDFTMDGTARRIAAVSMRVSGWTDWTHQFVDANTLSPPALTPSWGDTYDTLWIAVASGRPTTNVIDAPPPDFGGLVVASNSESTSTDRHSTGVAHRAIATTSLDPGSFGATGDFDDSNAWHIAVQGSLATQPGIRINDIKEPNIANELVTGVTNARVKVWIGTNDSDWEDEIRSNRVIENGTLEVPVSPEEGFTLNDTVTVEVMWTVGTERKLFITETTVVDLEGGT